MTDSPPPGWTRFPASCIIGHVSTPQSGILALGTTAHAFLEFDLRAERKGPELVRAIASLREPRTTIGGVNLVAGFRPEHWREAAPEEAPSDAEGFEHDVVGIEGFTMPATQHDAVLWLSGGRTTWSSTRPRLRSPSSTVSRRWLKRPRAGPTTTTEI